MDKNRELQWKETARWIKFEEDVEEETDRWGKPHVASLSFRSLLELRKTISHGNPVLLLLGWTEVWCEPEPWGSACVHRCSAVGPGPEDPAWYRPPSGGADDHFWPDQGWGSRQRPESPAAETQVSQNISHLGNAISLFFFLKSVTNQWKKSPNVSNSVLDKSKVSPLPLVVRGLPVSWCLCSVISWFVLAMVCSETVKNLCCADVTSRITDRLAIFWCHFKPWLSAFTPAATS